MRIPTGVLLWLIDRLDDWSPGPTDFTTIGPECFGVGWDKDGYPSHICFKAQTYVPVVYSRRVRLHNHLVSKLNARDGGP